MKPDRDLLENLKLSTFSNLKNVKAIDVVNTFYNHEMRTKLHDFKVTLSKST